MGDSRQPLIEQLDKNLVEFGMEVLGVFRPPPAELDFLDSGNGEDGKGDVIGLMIASFGRKMWPLFTASPHYSDGAPDPLNRWSGEVLGQVAAKFGADLRLPFERPYSPFQSWAKRTGKVEVSPLAILLHHQYGLWFGLRGVMFVKSANEQLDRLIEAPQSWICVKCIEKPCLNACPVNAFSGDGLRVKSCFSHLEQIEKAAISPNCLEAGCAARSACPQATEYQYCSAQLQFHMRAYYT